MLCIELSNSPMKTKARAFQRKLICHLLPLPNNHITTKNQFKLGFGKVTSPKLYSEVVVEPARILHLEARMFNVELH